MPGRSQTSIMPFLTIGSGSPSTMSYHQAGSPIGYSKAMKLCGSVAETWTSAARPSRPLPVPCGAIRMPCRSAYSAIHFSSAMPPTSQGSGPTMLTAWRLDQLLEVLAEIDLLAGVDRRRGGARHLAIDVGVDVRDVVAGDHVLEPHQVELLDRAGEADRVRHRPARAAIERQADLVAEHLLHRLDAGDDVLHAALGEQAAIERAVERARSRLAVVEVRAPRASSRCGRRCPA